VAAVVIALSSGSADADIITFDSLPTGTILANQFHASHGVRFSAINRHACHPDKLVIFDTANPTGGDYDLGYPWSGGNLGTEQLNQIFIIAENVWDCNHDGLVDNPDDEAWGGTVIIRFDSPIGSFTFDQVDRDDHNGDSVSFYINGMLRDTITYDAFAVIDSSIEYGNRKANHLPVVTADMVGGFFNEVRIRVCGSHGFDNIAFSETQVIPEPATMSLLGIGACVSLLRKRRRK